VPQFGEDPLKELDDVWKDPFGDEQKKSDAKHQGSLLLLDMHRQRRELICKKLEKRKQEEHFLKL
jgi:hypothetical protein